MERKDLTQPQIDKMQEFAERQEGKELSDVISEANPLVCGNGCVMIPFCGFFVGIEPDGQAHS